MWRRYTKSIISRRWEQKEKENVSKIVLLKGRTSYNLTQFSILKSLDQVLDQKEPQYLWYDDWKSLFVFQLFYEIQNT